MEQADNTDNTDIIEEDEYDALDDSEKANYTLKYINNTDNDDVIELRADLVANASETRKDTADFAKFRKEMIQKFG